jgi:hypothetical protein
MEPPSPELSPATDQLPRCKLMFRPQTSDSGGGGRIERGSHATERRRHAVALLDHGASSGQAAGALRWRWVGGGGWRGAAGGTPMTDSWTTATGMLTGRGRPAQESARQPCRRNRGRGRSRTVRYGSGRSSTGRPPGGHGSRPWQPACPRRPAGRAHSIRTGWSAAVHRVHSVMMTVTGSEEWRKIHIGPTTRAGVPDARSGTWTSTRGAPGWRPPRGTTSAVSPAAAPVPSDRPSTHPLCGVDPT